jgi:hypothetical protein
MSTELKAFKAIIKVVKSITIESHYGFDTVEVIREPYILANNKKEVKKILLEKHPQFFQNQKIYEKETKDQAQFFYVLIYELQQSEIKLIQEGSWSCDYCGQIHDNKYLHRPLISKKFLGKMFCSNNSYRENNIEVDCYERWQQEIAFKDRDLMDDLNYVKIDSPNYIYKITEKATNKSYIGKTRNAPFFRWWNHLKHSQSPFGKYLQTTKLSDWSFEVLEELPSNIIDSEILKIESSYIQLYDSIQNGFNSIISCKNYFGSK